MFSPCRRTNRCGRESSKYLLFFTHCLQHAWKCHPRSSEIPGTHYNRDRKNWYGLKWTTKPAGEIQREIIETGRLGETAAEEEIVENGKNIGSALNAFEHQLVIYNVQKEQQQQIPLHTKSRRSMVGSLTEQGCKDGKDSKQKTASAGILEKASARWMAWNGSEFGIGSVHRIGYLGRSSKTTHAYLYVLLLGSWQSKYKPMERDLENEWLPVWSRSEKTYLEGLLPHLYQQNRR